MAEVLLKKNIKVIVDDAGMVTLIAVNGEFCFMQILPSDLAKVVHFLVRDGYDFRVPKGAERGGCEI